MIALEEVLVVRRSASEEGAGVLVKSTETMGELLLALDEGIPVPMC